MSPGDFESTFIKAGHRETRKGLGWKETAREPRQCSALAPYKCHGKEVSHGGAAVGSLESQRKGTLVIGSGV